MADNIKYRFIQNVGDYFPPGYFGEDFLEKVQKCADLSTDEMKALCSPYIQLRHNYDEFKNFIINQNPRVKDSIKKTHDFHTRLLRILGYDADNAYTEPFVVNADTVPIEMTPVRHILRRGSQVKMLIMEMQHLIPVSEQEPAGLFEQQYESEPDRNTRVQRYNADQWECVFKLDRNQYKISSAIIDKAITQLFLMPDERRPHFILMMAGNTVFLFDQDKWSHGSYLQFSLDELFTQARIPTFRLYFALFHLLLSKQTLAADSEQLLMDAIIEESYKNAYEVTKDLKEGVILAIETLANEALYYMKNVVHKPFGKLNPETGEYDETNDSFEAEVKDDCLTIVYRLLFIFYAESRTELKILPINDEVYNRGYSLESLRDLEQVRLISQESRNGYFFDESIRHLFGLLSSGHKKNQDMAGDKSFSVRPIDSPLFNDNRLKQLKDVRIRNVKWQEIIKALSLSRKKRFCGRISYANLGVNQLGSVYESLLAFRGFYAEEDYIEVHKAGDPSDGTFLVPYSRMGSFDIKEVLCDEDTGEPKRLPKGTFVYRLNGRDRQKSASYYTPEILTRSTVKYTLKTFIDEVAKGKRKPQDLLELKILEPAMGAAAFQNEVINQLAKAYMTYVEKKPAPDKYRDELQKVKAYIATHNVYGMDLNPTAIELGKLSLWLNVIHKDMETPFFSNRLAVGNAVIGAWLKVYTRKEVVANKRRKGNRDILVPNAWWEKAPHKVKFYSTKVNRKNDEVYHFLLPDANALGVLNIPELKREQTDTARAMKEQLKDWLKPISSEDFFRLQRLSAKFDILLKEYFEFQQSIDALTNNRMNLWGMSGDVQVLNLESYYEKERLYDTRYRHDNAYFRLRTVMDYWCALYFWEYTEAHQLPTREDYWAEIEAILDVDDALLNLPIHSSRLEPQPTTSGMADLFQPEKAVNESLERYQTEEESYLIVKTKEEILAQVKGGNRLIDESQRVKYVIHLAKRYNFFHPMLEFLEVFWQKGGFDVICGNPPWRVPAFSILDTIAEKYPEVILHDGNSPEVRAAKEQYLKNEGLKVIYYSELIESKCSNAFTNSYPNYPYLKGIETDIYLCILENSLDLLSTRGSMGLIHPESVFDNARGQDFREEIYHRLRYHFQYQNELKLFAEVHHQKVYGVNIYGIWKNEPDFLSMHNLYHPDTIDKSLVHDGSGPCYSEKYQNKWNTAPHGERVVHFDREALSVLANTFEENDNPGPKLVKIHRQSILDVLEKLSVFKKHVRDYNSIITTALHETGAVDDGTMKRQVSQPESNEDIIINGPHIYVANPCYKMPRTQVSNNASYDVVNINDIADDFIPTTCFIPTVSHEKFRQTIKGFIIGQKNGEPIYDCWLDYYKLGISEWVGPTAERTLSGAILPPNVHHIGTIVSITFREIDPLIELAGLISSLPLDFYIKTTNSRHVKKHRIESFPLGIADIYKTSLFARILRLNCITNRYADLWSEAWRKEYLQETWSIEDSRLTPWNKLSPDWQHATPLRNYFERRMALVEIDVISAMALGLNLEELIMMYETQFPVLQQNEDDTWYDQKGNIVYTFSKGLIGIGVSRQIWKNIKDLTSGATYQHTIDRQKSELYAGQQVTYYAPFTKCDRVEDYRRAWAHFEKQFNSQSL